MQNIYLVALTQNITAMNSWTFGTVYHLDEHRLTTGATWKLAL